MYNKGTLLVAARPTAAIFTISNWIFSLKNPVIKIEFPALNKKWVDPQESDVKRTLSLQVGGE